MADQDQSVVDRSQIPEELTWKARRKAQEYLYGRHRHFQAEQDRVFAEGEKAAKVHWDALETLMLQDLSAWTPEHEALYEKAKAAEEARDVALVPIHAAFHEIEAIMRHMGFIA